jgi:RNA polymerase sigma factor (sigma-70 family)
MTTAAEAEAAETTTSAAPSSGSGRSGPEEAGAQVASLFAEHGRMVLGLCRLLLRDPVEAEDAAQQTFLSAHRSIDAQRLPREPAAWLAAIARNECRARIRLRMREPLSLPELPDDLPDPLATAIRSADLDALWAGLSELPRRQRRAFLLRELGGLSYSELGVALGVSRSAVESLLFRARRQLRALLAGPQAIVVPVTMRERLADLVPSFEPATAGAIGRVATLPVAAKLAAATVGAGLIAAGAAEVGSEHTPHSRSDPAGPRVVHALPQPSRTAPAAGLVQVRTAPRVAADQPRNPAGHEQDEAEGGEAESQEPEHPSRERAATGDEGAAVEPSATEERAKPETADEGGQGGESGGGAEESDSGGD